MFPSVFGIFKVGIGKLLGLSIHLTIIWLHLGPFKPDGQVGFDDGLVGALLGERQRG